MFEKLTKSVNKRMQALLIT